MEAKLIGAGIPRQRWSALLAGQMETVQLINLAMNWADVPWETAVKSFLESQQSVRSVELQRLELMSAVLAEDEAVSDFVIRFNYLRGLVTDVSDATVRDLFVAALKPRKDLYKRLADAIEVAKLTTGQSVGLKALQETAASLAAVDDDALKKRGRSKAASAPQQPKSSESPKFKGKCRKCGIFGHKEADCRKAQSEKQDDKCKVCFQSGHWAKNCPKRKIRMVGVEEKRDATEPPVKRLTVDPPTEELDNDWIADLGELLDPEEMPICRVQRTQSGCLTTPCLFEGHKIVGLVDSGAAVSVIAKSWCSVLDS
jgi:hypothetical protein